MIDLIQQPTDKTCTSACLAMITGIPVDFIVNNFHDDYVMFRERKIFDFLYQCNIQPKALKFGDSLEDIGDGVYLVTVPSLNNQATMHHIVLISNDNLDTEIQIYDPNQGRDGKKYYTLFKGNDDSELAVGLGGYSLDLFFPLSILNGRDTSE